MTIISHLTSRRHFRPLIALLAADLVLFGGINAKNTPSIMLIVGFVLLLMTLYCLFQLILAVARLYGFQLASRRRLALYLTGVAGVLLALKSINELSPRDVAVILPLALISYLYSSYGSNKQPAPKQPAPNA